ncbi:MAG: HAD family phosphatase [Spirochaetaceae bacterium]|nr:HAD family phosphatase [Spirochaetaceae bacterium]RKX81531.1 MAG: hypothetical protein DRP60_00455 [Spirochaetota bacterium]RKX90600.1 MAG: hypothetical protein DRP70_00080 [Spirochaetota bacterium]RKX98425.1 MAG: hypothetical protein DRZ90_02920 [Spirochaetota bacterium]
MNNKGIVFDLDGVLFDTEPLHREAWNNALDEFGIDVTPQELMVWTGVPCQEISVELAKRWKGRYSSGEYYALKEKHFHRIISSRDSLFPGLAVKLEELASNLPLAIATTNTRVNAELLLVKAGIDRYFSTIVCYEDVKNHKPHPEPYLKASGQIQVKGSDCIAIEDSPSGCSSSRAAGMFTLGITSSFSSSDLGEANLIFPSTPEACSWIIKS